VKGRDIAVILGPSGAGKTTTVQMLLGYKQMLKKSTIEGN
jgi:ABC-type multidrug transport system ATPase subunit